MTDKIYILNSAMMPEDAFYEREEITEEEFCSILRESKEIVSSIGYEQVSNHIYNISNIRVPVNRGITKLEEKKGLVLVCRLKFRPEAYEKGNIKATPGDYEYLKVHYTKKKVKPTILDGN